MATIKDKLYFNFNGISSKTFGLVHVELGNGMYDETLVANRTINETKQVNNDQPIFNGLEYEPLSFELNLAFEKGFNSTLIDDVIRWLFTDYYKPLYFEGNEEKIYYCMPEGNSSITHNGLEQGYVTITMRCKSSKLTSPLKMTQEQIVPSSGSTTVTINNTGHETVYPEISFTKTGSIGEVVIRKNSTNEIVRVKNLKVNESIYIDTFKEIIETNAIGTYRYNDVYGDFRELELTTGQNTYTITGAGKIQFRYRLKYKF